MENREHYRKIFETLKKLGLSKYPTWEAYERVRNGLPYCPAPVDDFEAEMMAEAERNELIRAEERPDIFREELPQEDRIKYDFMFNS